MTAIGEIGGCTTEPASRRKDIPQNFAEADYGWRMAHACPYFLRSSSLLATSNCFRSSAPTSGYASFNSFNVSTIAAATNNRVYHLLSAGTTYHGACLLDVAAIISSYAVM